MAWTNLRRLIIKGCTLTRNHFADVFSLDTRSLAVFRILLGLAQIYNLIERMESAELFLSDDGWFPRSECLHWTGSWELSIHLLSGNYYLLIAFLALHMGIAVCFLVGHNTFVMTVISFILTSHLGRRSIVTTSGAEGVLKTGLFFACFLPISDVFSVDAALLLAKRVRSGEQSEHPSGARYAMRVGRRVWSWGTVGLVVQFFNVYLTAASLKLMDPHWLQGIATWNAISLPSIARPLARCLTEFPRLCQLLTWGTLVLEAGMPAAWVLLPSQWKYTKLIRVLLVAGPLGMHAVMHFTLSVAWFQLVIIAPIFALMPSEFWDWAWLRFNAAFPPTIERRHPPPGTVLRTSAGDTRLLTIAGTFLACHPDDIVNVINIVSTAQQQPVALAATEQHDTDPHTHPAPLEVFMEEVVVEGNHELDEPQEPLQPPQSGRTDLFLAMRIFCQRSPALGPFAAVLEKILVASSMMSQKLTGKLTEKFPEGRRVLDKATRVCRLLGSRLHEHVSNWLEVLPVPEESVKKTPPPRPGRSCLRRAREDYCNSSLLALFMIVCISTSNFNDVSKRSDFNPLYQIMHSSGLTQSWHMFSPVPTTEDQWWVMAARLKDTSSIDLMKEPDVPGYWQNSVPWRLYLWDFLGLTTDAVNARKAENYMQAVAHPDNQLSWRRPEAMWYRTGNAHHLSKWFERYAAKFDHKLQDMMMKWYCQMYNQEFLPKEKRLDYVQLVKFTQRLPPSLNPDGWWMEETRKAQLELFGELSPDVAAHFEAKNRAGGGKENSRIAELRRNSTAKMQPDLNVAYRIAQHRASNDEAAFLGDFDNVYECEKACWEQNFPKHEGEEAGYCYSFAFHPPDFKLEAWRRGCYGTKSKKWKPVKDEGVISGGWSVRQIQVLHKPHINDKALEDPMWWWMPEQPWRSNEASYGRPEPYTVLTWGCSESADKRKYIPLLLDDELRDMNRGFMTRGQPNAAKLPPPKRPPKDLVQHHFDHLVNRKVIHLEGTLSCLLNVPYEDPAIYRLFAIFIYIGLWIGATRGAQSTPPLPSSSSDVTRTEWTAPRENEFGDTSKNM